MKNLISKKTVILFVFAVILLSLIYIYFRETPTEEELTDPLQEKIIEQKGELDAIREERRGEDYIPPTEIERSADIERQIRELEELRQSK